MRVFDGDLSSFEVDLLFIGYFFISCGCLKFYKAILSKLM